MSWNVRYGNGVVDVDIPQGVIPVVMNGYLDDGNIRVGPIATMFGENGKNLEAAPTTPNTIPLIFEVFVSPTMRVSTAKLHGNLTNARKVLQQGGERSFWNEVASKEMTLRNAGGHVVWRLWRQPVTCLPADSPPNVGVVVYAQLAMFGVTKYMHVWNERSEP